MHGPNKKKNKRLDRHNKSSPSCFLSEVPIQTHRPTPWIVKFLFFVLFAQQHFPKQNTTHFPLTDHAQIHHTLTSSSTNVMLQEEEKNINNEKKKRKKIIQENTWRCNEKHHAK